MTLAPTDAQIDAERFGYTGNGQDHVLVDIDVSPVPDAAVRVCLPITDGLRGAAGRQRLYIIRFSSGEWEELSSETEDDAVCADVSGFSPFALVFQIDHAKRRVGNVNRAILPELARAVTASTLEAITSRMEDARTGGGTANALNAQAPPEPEPGHQKVQLRLGELENGETLSLTDAVDGSYYSVSLAGGYDAPQGESEAEPSPLPAPAVWECGSRETTEASRARAEASRTGTGGLSPATSEPTTGSGEASSPEWPPPGLTGRSTTRAAEKARPA